MINLLRSFSRASPAEALLARPVTVATAGRRPRWWLEAMLVAALCTLYDTATNLAPLRSVAAVTHGRALLAIEGSLALSPERGLDRWLSAHHLLALLASDFYDNAHFVVTIGVLVWLWVWQVDRYRPLRRALVLTNLGAFIVFLVYPTAPPRLIPGAGFVDIVAQTHAIGSWHTGSLARTADQYAAMPSLHLAWASWSVLAIWRAVGARSGRWLLALYPLTVGIVVLSTGNHYVLDVIAGGALAIGALVVGRLEPRGIPSVLRRPRDPPVVQPPRHAPPVGVLVCHDAAPASSDVSA